MQTPKELEYIESTGTQYVDTGVIPNQDTRIIADFQYTKSDTGYRFIGCENRTNNNQKFRFGTSGGTAWLAGYGSSETVKYEPCDLSRHVLDFNKNIVNLDEITIFEFEEQTFTSYGNAYIFSVNSDNIADLTPAILYFCKIYDNDVLVRDFVPYKDEYGVVCLYDKINDKKYYNAGTGEFTAGEEV